MVKSGLNSDFDHFMGFSYSHLRFNDVKKLAISRSDFDLTKIPECVSIAREIRDDLRQRRIPFFFVAFPAHGMFTNATFEGTIDPVLEALAEVEIDGIDPSSEFRASGLTAEELYCLPHDGHPDAKAYEICGRVVADALRAHLKSASSPPLAIPE